MSQDKSAEKEHSDISDIVCLDSSTDDEQEEKRGDEKEETDLPTPRSERLLGDDKHKEAGFDLMVEDEEEDISDNDSSEEEVGDKAELRQSSVSFKRRFNVTSSEESSSSDSFIMKDVAQPGISGYSKVEPDFSSESEAEVVGGFDKENEPENTSIVEAGKVDPAPTEYSRMEPDFESEDEVHVEEKDKATCTNKSAAVSCVNMENTGVLSLEHGKKDSDMESGIEAPVVAEKLEADVEEKETEETEGEDEEMEEEEEGEEEEEEFELKFTETPTAVSRRATRQRFSLSSAASSDDEAPRVKDVEASPVLDSKEENEEADCSVSDEEIDREPASLSNRTSIFKVFNSLCNLLNSLEYLNNLYIYYILLYSLVYS